jgi:hypothetical protein
MSARRTVRAAWHRASQDKVATLKRRADQVTRGPNAELRRLATSRLSLRGEGDFG